MTYCVKFLPEQPEFMDWIKARQSPVMEVYKGDKCIAAVPVSFAFITSNQKANGPEFNWIMNNLLGELLDG